MAETLPPETIDNPTENNIAPNFNSELDAALSKSSLGKHQQVDTEIKDKPPIEEPDKQVKKIEEPIKQEVKIEEVKKPVPEDKNLPDPDQVGDAPSGKSSNASKEGWNALKNNYKRAHRIAQEKDAEITKLKATLADKSSASQKEIEAIKAELAENKKYRAMVEIEADPEFMATFDKPLEALVSDIKSFLKERNVTEEGLKNINLNDTKTMSQLIGIIDKEEGELTASELRGKIREYLDLSRKRTQTINDQKNNYKETLEKKKQESFAKGAENEGRMIKHLELKASEKDEKGNPRIPFLSKIEPKENATPAELQQVDNHNTLVEDMNKKLQGVLKMKEPEQQAEIAIAAIASHWLLSQLKVSNEALNKAKEELQKISVVTTETPSRKPATVSKNGNGEYVDTDKAITAYFGRNR